MKKILLFSLAAMMLALVSLTASAQGIKNGSKWNISNLVYEALFCDTSGSMLVRMEKYIGQ